MRIDEEYYVVEVLRGRYDSNYWSACNKDLAERVFDEIKKHIPEARYYEYGGLQIITTNKHQERTLLNLLDAEKDICEIRLSTINAIRRKITRENENV